MSILDKPAPEAAEGLIGMTLLRRLPDGREIRARITETEAYFRQTDTACHARFGRTKRSEMLYRPAGTIYVYLCYGIHWMLNLVTGPEDDPQAVLIRGVEGASGPGRVTKYLAIDGGLNGTCLGEDLGLIEEKSSCPAVKRTPRIGIDYASAEDRARLWRFVAE